MDAFNFNRIHSGERCSLLTRARYFAEPVELPLTRDMNISYEINYRISNEVSHKFNDPSAPGNVKQHSSLEISIAPARMT